MPRRSKDERHRDVLRQLMSWAERNKVADDPYILGLSNALENRDNLPFWASLNHFDLFPRLKKKSKRRNISSLLALIRNVLIFVPIALTWTSVGKATVAFQVYNQKNPDSLSNFLDFWQNGYGVLSDIWKIGHVAALDALIIFLLIVLIVVIHFLNQRIRVEENTLQSESDEERQRLVIEISQYLFLKRHLTDLTMKDALANATHNLVSAAQNIEKSTKEFHKINKDSSLAKIVTHLKKTQRDPFDFLRRSSEKNS